MFQKFNQKKLLLVALLGSIRLKGKKDAFMLRHRRMAGDRLKHHMHKKAFQLLFMLLMLMMMQFLIQVARCLCCSCFSVCCCKFPATAGCSARIRAGGGNIMNFRQTSFFARANKRFSRNFPNVLPQPAVTKCAAFPNLPAGERKRRKTFSGS